MRCMKALNMLLQRRLSQDRGDRERLQGAMNGHVMECRECREFLDLLRSDSIEAENEPKRYTSGLSKALVKVREWHVSQPEGGIGVARHQGIGTETKGKFFTLFIDGKEFHVEKSEFTGAEIMDLGGIPRELGLILVEEDGTQVQVNEDDVVELKPGRRFKKAPRFIRG